MTVGLVVAMFVALVPASRQAVKEGLRRKRALEGLLAKLDENPAGSWNVVGAEQRGQESLIAIELEDKTGSQLFYLAPLIRVTK